MKQYIEFEDGFKQENELIHRVDEFGVSKEKINSEALYDDQRAFWSFHERKLHAMIIVCSLYFLAVIL